MKKQFKMLVLSFMGMLSIASCTNEEVINVASQIETRGVATTFSKEIFRFKYQGVQYASEYEIVDSTMVFDDPQIANMICDLESNPLVATLTYPNGVVEYFDSNEELEKKLEVGDVSYESVSSRSDIILYNLLSMRLIVYEHADFQGKSLTFNGPVSIPDMSNVYNDPIVVTTRTDFNDMISSFQLIGEVGEPFYPYKPHFRAVVTFYEDINYEYGSASFLIDRDYPQISHDNFKKVKRCSYCKYNMNDRTSSIKLQWLDD